MLTVKERELIVKLHHEGKRQQYIADLLGCSQPTVHKWIRLAERRSTLETLPRSGRPTRISTEVRDLLKQTLIARVKGANEQYCSLTTKQLSEIIKQETGTAYSLRHVERLMHQLGFSRITPRPQHLRHDQAKVDAFRDEFKKNFGRNTWVMSL